ncbi:hypothetical protein CEUSTIGMA_g13202.t1 [Chlamydomonas eustigma]|uniref:Major facilitator superfamily (MFS) profile domain-containing protein n=1 Tax=Chlamydomonas eustigma TaxID=1157962 RepID=A0A250XRS4_9CHLO|nr:hypothetical protein CEUSTIGMA_g13202.t1 [Chlamydomonas eustigma]|eukprot:GAX85787.1 hypothetical protein CEUSTIGMA_g13202.t1 [Chlamydomonas eustigma]
MVGFASLVWGPASDKYGRKIIYIAASIFFIATSIVCMFAPNIGVLVAFRALQGISVAAFLSVGSGTLADVFPPFLLGTANGLFMIPLLVGPIIGPLLGGGLAQAFGWRSTFICLTVFSGAVILPLLLLKLPETQQFKELQKLKEKNPVLAASLKEAEFIDSNPPVFHPPWVPLRFLLEGAIFPHALVASITFGSMFASLTEFPIALSAAPYSLSVGIIGVCYLPQGVGSFLASPIFGKLSDYAASKNPDEPEARLVYSTLSTLIMMPPALLLYGWALDYKISIAACLIGQFFIGASCASYLPGIFGYLAALKQSAAGAASAAVQTTMFVSAGALIIVSSVVVGAIGMGPFFTILAGLQFIFSLAAFILIMKKKRASEVRQAESPPPKSETA